MVSSIVDSNKNVHPILGDGTGRPYVVLSSIELDVDEVRIFQYEEIRDTDAHNSDVTDCSHFNSITIWVENDLDKDVSVQIRGNRVNSTTDAVDIGDAFDVATDDIEARTIEPITAGFLPYIFIEATAAVAPTAGGLKAYLIRKPT